MKKVTLIIPVYNSEKYIRKCLDSLVRQTSKDFIAYLINDGSKDQSLQIIESYQKQYPDLFLVINQENKGVVETRMRGIQESQSEYIMFIDNDDYLEEDYVEVLLGEIEKENCDIVISGYRRVNTTKTMFEIKAGDDAWTKYRITAPWARIYRRQFLIDHHITFKKGIGEDVYFNLQAYSCTNKIKGIDYIGYNWFFNDQSVSNTDQRGLQDCNEVFDLLNKIDQLYNTKDKDLHYFFVRYGYWYLLFSGKMASSRQFIKVYHQIDQWKREKHIKNPYHWWSKEIRSEPLNIRCIVSIMAILDKLKLMKLFSKIYCKG